MKLKSSLLNKLIEASSLIDNTRDEEMNIGYAKEVIANKDYCALMAECWGSTCKECNTLFAKKYNLPMIYETSKERL